MDTQFKKGVLELLVLLFTTKCDRYGYELVEEVSKVVNINERTRYPNYDFYKIILNDIKNKKLYNYDDFRSIKLEVIANENTLNKLNIEG